MEKNFDKLKEAFLAYVDQNKLDGNQIIKTADDLCELAVRRLSQNDPYVYVFKRGRFLERFSQEKIQNSIARAGRDAGVQMSSSDLSLLVREALKPHKDDQLIFASDLRKSVAKALKANGFSQVEERYSDH